MNIAYVSLYTKLFSLTELMTRIMPWCTGLLHLHIPARTLTLTRLRRRPLLSLSRRRLRLRRCLPLTLHLGPILILSPGPPPPPQHAVHFLVLPDPKVSPARGARELGVFDIGVRGANDGDGRVERREVLVLL